MRAARRPALRQSARRAARATRGAADLQDAGAPPLHERLARIVAELGGEHRGDCGLSLVGAVTGAISLSKVGDLEEKCPDHRCSPADQATADQARTLGTVSTVGFIAGGALVAAGVVLLVIRPSGGDPAAARSGLRVTAATAGPGGITLRGTF